MVLLESRGELVRGQYLKLTLTPGIGELDIYVHSYYWWWYTVHTIEERNTKEGRKSKGLKIKTENLTTLTDS